MRVGCPKEIKNHEYRVGITPAAAREYVEAGHEVLIETNAGGGIGADDDTYRAAGATIVGTAQDVFAKADMVVKVKEPQPAEWQQLRSGQILYTYLHLAADRPQTEGLMASGCTAIAYETVTGREGGLPLLAPMSEVAGRLSIQAAARSLEAPAGGEGLLLGGVPGVAPAKVTVIGGGVVGTQAAKMAVGLGADVTILDRSLPRLRQLDDMFEGRARCLYSTVDAIAEQVALSDTVIGAVLIPGASAPKLVTAGMIKTMRPGTVVVDVAIDQGGCFETSKATTHADPTYVVDGVVHYCVANMPGAVPKTSSHALNNATLHHGVMLANMGLEALIRDPHLRNGLNVHRGQVVNQQVAESLNLDYCDPSTALAA
ncbi:MAG: alanine dehydrogenase [Pseudomonadota bacterium]